MLGGGMGGMGGGFGGRPALETNKARFNGRRQMSNSMKRIAKPNFTWGVQINVKPDQKHRFSESWTRPSSGLNHSGIMSVPLEV